MPKKYLLVFLVSFLILIIPALYFIDKAYFLCPIEYEKGIIIRRDSRGDGDFDVQRMGKRRHEGIDLCAQIGAEVRAASFAWVKEAEFHQRLGNYVELRHPGDLTTIYGHLQQVLVKPKRLIPQGKVIGYVGKTGNASHSKILPHLHFEIRRNNTPVNPLEWIEGK